MNDDTLHARLEALVADRLAHWPTEWEGFHWPGYTYHHTLRVRNLALKLAEEEGADAHVVSIAALLHDICKAEGKNHARLGAEEAAQILAALQVPPDTLEAVRHAIDTHSGDNTHEHPAENRVLGDADLIDANFGLVATWRFICIRASRESSLEETIAGMADWLPRKDELMDLLRSDPGRQVAAERSGVMHRFCQAVAEALAAGAPGDTGLLGLTEMMAADWQRPYLADLLERVRAWEGADAEVLAACDRLEAEAAGEV